LVARETVYLALLAQLQTAGSTFKTYTRRWKSAWDDPAQQVAAVPMLIQQEQTENVTWTNRGIGAVRIWDVRLEIYGKIPPNPVGAPGVPDSDTPGSTVLNPLIDAVEAALAPGDKDGYQTLGGLVIDCRVEGTIIKVLGDEDPSGLCGAIIPLRIVVP